MNTIKGLTAERIKELNSRPIDLSDIHELTKDEAKELYPRNQQQYQQNRFASYKMAN